MNINEHILTCISEECSEIIKDISKALRFGIDDINPETKQTNRLAIAKELNDLIAVVELAIENYDLLDANVIDGFVSKELKKRKVLNWMEYAKTKGTISGETA